MWRKLAGQFVQNIGFKPQKFGIPEAPCLAEEEALLDTVNNHFSPPYHGIAFKNTSTLRLFSL